MVCRWKVLSLAFVAAVAASQASALQVFDDKAAFLSATGATSASGPLPALRTSVSSLLAGSITITSPNAGAALIVGQTSPGHFGTPLLMGNEITLIGLENINYALAAPAFSFGFDFAEPGTTAGCGVACVDSSFSVTMWRSGSVVDTFVFNAPNDVASFVGMWSESSFDFVAIRETTGSNDSEFFGEVYAGGVSPVPEVPAGWTLALALPMLGSWVRRSRSATSSVR